MTYQQIVLLFASNETSDGDESVEAFRLLQAEETRHLHGTILLFTTHRQDQQNGVKSSGLSSPRLIARQRSSLTSFWLVETDLLRWRGTNRPQKPFARHLRGTRYLLSSVIMNGRLLKSCTKRGRCCGRDGFDCEGKDGRAGV